MSNLRLAKLAQLMKEAKEQYFNLYNDMKDSIYVNQKGRTVSDVEVLPGKTLSGCITSSDLTVYFTNLMGGKDSKVISSNELMTLLPSLTTKKGELSPTLNISKVLINVVIQKYNSANKLAGMRKIAEEQRLFITNNLPFSIQLEQISGNKINLNTGQGSNAFNYNQRIDMTIADERYKSYSGLLIGPADLVKLKPTNGSDKSIYITELNYNLKELKAELDKASAATTGNKAQKSRGGAAVKHTDIIKQDLWTKTVKDNDGYTFVIGADGKSLTYSKNKSAPKTLNQYYGNWPQLVKSIDKLTAIDGSDSAAKTTGTTEEAAKPADAAAPAKTEEAKPAETAGKLNASAVAGVEAVLRRASANNERGLGGKTWNKNEKGRILDMVSNIQKLYKGRLGTDGAYNFLAQMIVNENQQTMNAFFGQDISKEILTADRKDLIADPRGARGYQRHVSAVLGELNKLFDGNYADDKQRFIYDYAKQFASEKPSEEKEPAEKAAAASRVDPKIKKLATLRRLRVRSQMEAATESSTRFGRSRIS